MDGAESTCLAVTSYARQIAPAGPDDHRSAAGEVPDPDRAVAHDRQGAVAAVLHDPAGAAHGGRAAPPARAEAPPGAAAKTPDRAPLRRVGGAPREVALAAAEAPAAHPEGRERRAPRLADPELRALEVP